jgi:biopolymer transport protein ExbD
VVVVRADPNATHQWVVRVWAAARAPGLQQITFTTQSSR